MGRNRRSEGSCRKTSTPVYHQSQHLGNKWADAHAEAEMLEEAKKCVLATITLHYITDGNTKAAAEVQAFASQEYQDHAV